MVFKGSKIQRAIAVASLLVMSCSSQISLVIFFSSVGTTMAGTCPTIPAGGCSICAGQKCVGNPDNMLTDTNGIQKTCAAWQEDGLTGLIPGGPATGCLIFLSNNGPGMQACGCTANPPDSVTTTTATTTATTIQVTTLPQTITLPQTTMITSTSTGTTMSVSCPTIPAGGCSICGGQKCVGNPDNMLTDTNGVQKTCAAWQDDGFTGRIPFGAAVGCLIFLSNNGQSIQNCGCKDNPPDGSTTTMAATTQGPPKTTAATTPGNSRCINLKRRLDFIPEESSVGNLNLVVAEEVSSYGNLRAVRSRNLNGWFDCGSNTHCVKDRATCAVDANGIGICTCMDGYAGSQCQPVNECEVDSPCPGGSVCVDMFPPMRFKCVCKDGFTPFLPNELPNEPDVPLEYRSTSCIDDLECDDDKNPPCHPDAKCTNTIGSFECACNEGLVGNGITTCNTQDEVSTAIEAPRDGSCMIDTDCQGSNMQCANSTCLCLPGYAQVGANCQNEVHCDTAGRNNDCHRRATCTEEDGFPGFSCACIEGWEDAYEGANGKSCKNIPPVTETPPEPVTEAVTDRPGVGPHPNRPTVFRPKCLADGAPCEAASDCCGGGCSLFSD